MDEKHKGKIAINDYSCLHDKCSEFLYKALDFVQAFAIRKHYFNEVMRDSYGQKLKVMISRDYKKYI